MTQCAIHTHTQKINRGECEREIWMGQHGGWKAHENGVRIDCQPERNLLAALESTLAINRVSSESTRLVTTMVGNYQIPTPTATGGHRCWLAVSGCAERDDLMPGACPTLECARFSKIISGIHNPFRKILHAIRIHYCVLSSSAIVDFSIKSTFWLS